MEIKQKGDVLSWLPHQNSTKMTLVGPRVGMKWFFGTVKPLKYQTVHYRPAVLNIANLNFVSTSKY